MRIQARIFLVVSILILALVSVQVWLHFRQMRAVEKSLGVVATAVGRDLLTRELEVGGVGHLLARAEAVRGSAPGEEGVLVETESPEIVVEVLDEGGPNQKHVIKRVFRQQVGEPEEGATTYHEEIDIYAVSEGDVKVVGDHGVWHQGARTGEETTVQAKVFYLELSENGQPGERTLVISDDLGEETEIPIPTSPTMDVFRSTFTRSLAASAVLLGVGLLASAVVARRLAKPLQDLAGRTESLAQGGFGQRIPVTTSGEVGELEAAFDRMSVHLEALEHERDQWRRREHLAQLGDLSRGLAHTIRNPLHTLGLAVEELAGEGDDPRVRTARKQIRRIDRWIRSFLALGAEGAAAPEAVDLRELVQDCLLEVGPESAEVRLGGSTEPVAVSVVPTAVRAALSNLVENAVQAAPGGTAVEVDVFESQGDAVVTVRDRGPGIPPEIRDRLFEPHQTTRRGGAGMGLYLARQIVEEMHRGRLEIEDADGGGSIARIVLPAETSS
jgi:signal transduction histidine kinase